MRVLRRFLARLANFVAWRRGDQRLREEMEEHLAMQMEENLRSGMSPAEAPRQAALKFGAAEAVKENYHDEQGLPFIENLLQDVRYAWRQMRKSPSFTLLTALILTLGIGVNTAIFSLVDHILLEPLPFSQPDHLYSVWAHSDAQGNARIAASGPDFLDYQDQSRSFSLIAEYLPYFSETWTGDGDPKLLHCTGISEAFFDMLGVRQYMGRFNTAKEYTDLRNPTTVVSYRFWKSKLGGDPHVLGRVIHANEVPLTVVGVAPPLPVAADTEAVYGFADYSTPGNHRISLASADGQFVDMGEDGVHALTTVPVPKTTEPPAPEKQKVCSDD
jgi:MacB-like periplasmic core domain